MGNGDNITKAVKDQPSSANQPHSGVGTDANRGAQQADVAAGKDTKAPGVPSPQQGGPDAPTPPGQTSPSKNS